MLRSFKSTYVLFLLIVLGGGMSAQDLTGIVVDGDEVSLPSAQLILKSGTEIKGYALTDNNGKYGLELRNPITDSTTLEVRFFGFATRRFNSDEINAEALKRIVLHREALELKEVVVSGSLLPQVDRGDTIVFNTEAYRDGSEKKIEEVIAKLPGVEVDDQGKIKVQGKPLERILVDGEDVFDRDYKMLSRNVPADFVRQVEVLTNYHQDDLVGDLSGSKGVALNLRLDESRKGLVFGEIKGALGNADYRAGHANLFHLGKKVKAINFSDYGSTGEASSAGGYLLMRNQNLGGRAPEPTAGLLSSGAERQNNLLRPTDYLNNEAFGTAQSLLFNLGSQIKNRLLVSASSDAFQLSDQLLRENINATGVDSFNQKNNHQYRRTGLWLKNDMNIRLSPKSRLDLRATFSGNRTDAGTSIVNQNLADGTTEELGTQLEDNPYGYLTSLRYVHRLSKSLALNFSTNWQEQRNNEQQLYRGAAYQQILWLEPAASELLQRVDMRTSTLSTELNILHRLRKGQFAYTAGYRNTQATVFANLSAPEIELNAQAPVLYAVRETYLKTSWNRKWQNLAIGATTTGTFFDLDRRDARTTGTQIALQPRLNVSYDLNQRNSLSVWASDLRKAPTADQMLDQPYLADGTTLVAGLDSAYLLKERTLGFQYRYNNQFKQYGYSLRLFQTSTPNALQREVQTENFVIVNRLIAGGTSKLRSAIASANFYLSKTKTSLKVSGRVTQILDQLDFGGGLLPLRSTNYRATLRVNTTLLPKVKYGLHTVFDWFENQLEFEVSNQRQAFVGQKIVAIPLKGAKGILKYDLYAPRLGGNNPARVIHLLGVECSYELPETPWEFSFGANNLLNEDTLEERNLSAFLRSTRTIFLRPRTFYLSAEWSF